MGAHVLGKGEGRCPRQDSNLRTSLRRRVLYPLSYGGPGLISLEHGRSSPSASRKSRANASKGAPRAAENT
jgi:hypothetical protein